jgi:hypothetical protein
MRESIYYIIFLLQYVFFLRGNRISSVRENRLYFGENSPELFTFSFISDEFLKETTSFNFFFKFFTELLVLNKQYKYPVTTG